MTKNIYTIINFLVIGAIIFTGVNTFYRVFNAKLDQPDFGKTPVIKKSVETNRPRTRRSLRDYDIINRSGIFGKIADDTVEESIDTTNIEPTSLNISLVATWVVNQGDSSAVIAVRSKRPPEGLYRVGDSVEGALIKKILRNKVILNINNKDQILEMDDESTGMAGSVSASYPPMREPGGPVSRPSNSPLTRTIPLQKDDIEAALSDLPNILTQASVKQHFTDGQPDGLAITGVKAGSIFRKMGLRNGDIVKSVDGRDIRSTDDLISFYNDLQSADEVSFQIIRRGQERTNVLKLR